MAVRRAIDRPRPSSPSGSTHHNQDQSWIAPESCSSSLGRDRPRPCSLGRASCTATLKSIFTHRRWLGAPKYPVCVVELHAATGSIASAPLERRIRGCPIPIANAAPSHAYPLPRFRPLASCRRRLLARADASLGRRPQPCTAQPCTATDRHRWFRPTQRLCQLLK